ncbi:MAG: type IX secretion system membrane protein PorP/SprF [Pedobacter sp.]|nr:MAG: type IX secretion system membrane protein PorP/SprF [Pedobacter sp.]
MKTYSIILLWGLLFLASFDTLAQVDPLTAQYYTNQYLGNPAMAGWRQGVMINGSIRKNWSNIPGTPATQNLTADYGFGKLGVGLKLYNEQAGLQRQTSGLGTFSYHLPLSADEQQLHFGISIGLLNQRIETSDLRGNQNDIIVGNYNDRRTYLDGDFGLAYTNKRFTLQGSVPNLKNVFKRDVIKLVDVATFYAAASYQIPFGLDGTEAELEPKIAYRGVRGFNNVWDAGAQLSFAQKQIQLTGLYHNTGSATFGIGMDLKKRFLISGLYTAQTSQLSSYTNGVFELNLRLHLDK